MNMNVKKQVKKDFTEKVVANIVGDGSFNLHPDTIDTDRLKYTKKELETWEND